MDKQAIVCEFKDCNLIYEDPVALPCGNSLCQHHLKTFDDKFVCYFCNNEHQNEFNVNKAMVKMINNHFQLDPLRKKIKESFYNLSQTIQEYDSIDRDSHIYDYFQELRNKVDLHREELIKEIIERSEEIIKQLKEKEEECKLNAAKLDKMNLNELKNENLPSWKHKFRMPEINQNELNDLLNKMNEALKVVTNENKNFKNELLLNKSFQFDRKEKSSLFGELVIKNVSLVLPEDCGKLLKSFIGHTQCIYSIEQDQISNKIISVSMDKKIKIWDFETSECLKTLNEHQSSVLSILLIPNNKLISGSEDQSIKIWDLNSYECLKTIENQSGVYSLCLISNNQIACGCYDGFINIWNLQNSQQVKSFKAHDNWIRDLKLLEKSSKLISCSDDKLIKIWNISSFECIKVLESHSDYVYFIENAFDEIFLSCSGDQTIKIWQKETFELIKSIKFDYPVFCVKMLNKDLIAIGLGDDNFFSDNNIGHIIIYDLEKMQVIKTINAHSTYIYRLHLLSNGNLLSGSENGVLKLWKLLE